MALFDNKDPTTEIMQLRNQGLTDNLIVDELKKKGFDEGQVNSAIAQLDGAAPMSAVPTPGLSSPQPRTAPSAGLDTTIYSRIEEISETIIDEKWSQLIAEVKKIIAWKDKVEQEQRKMASDVQKLKEDFSVLHKGVLGKLDDYDSRMQDVGTELNAVGKVFKDVIPEFVENVKELSHLTEKMKKD